MTEGQLSLADLELDAAAVDVPVARARPEPTPEQADAVAARARDAFLEAGAGTGKTTVLVDRYCASIADDGVAVDRVLAFTFTERAAAEMRTRIRRELVRRSRAARDAGDSVRHDELRALARATERAWVMTIHAFCRRLLATHPLAAGLDPAFRVLDANQAGRLRGRAFRATLDELLAAGDAQVARAAAAYEPWRLTVMTLSAHERLRSQGMTDPRLPPVGDPVQSPKSGAEPEPLSPAEIEAAVDARGAFETLLEVFHSRYERLKEERSALDFSDLELRALALLRSSPALAGAWSERFDQVMVDEFQDTNRVQLQLVELLRGPQTKVFMVGDENQSIYRFRNADLEVFRRERRDAEADPTRDVLPLRGNFRCRPAVLAAVNAVGGALLNGFNELTAGRVPDTGPGAVELLLTLDEGTARDARRWDAQGIDLDPAPSASAAKVIAEARFLAERLRELVESEQADRGDIVVLLRAFTHVDAYEQALARAGLRPFVVGGRGYWTQQQVEDLIRLLGVVSNPLDDEHLFGALASFANGVSPDALWLLRQAATGEGGGPRHVWPVLRWRFGDAPDEPPEGDPEWLDRIEAQDAQRLERFCSIVAGLRARAPMLTLEELVERTMDSFGYDLGLIARPGGVGRMANVRKLMRLARDYEASEGRNLGGFLALAAESTERDEREGMAAVQAEDHDGVRVMTVHAAKGLEFPVVAVPDLGRGLAAGHRPGDLVIGPPPELGAEGPHRFGMRLAFAAGKSFGLWELTDLNEAENIAEAEEGCRLTYVAASRAEDRLILSGLYKPKDLEPLEQPGSRDSALRRLLPALVERSGGEWTGGPGVITLAGPRPIGSEERLAPVPLEVRISEPSPERAAELARRFDPPPEPERLAGVADPPPLIAESSAPVPVGHLSYSALAQYERCGYRFYVERILGSREAAVTAAPRPGEDADAPAAPAEDELTEPEVPRNLALGIGNAVHAALEWSAHRAWEAPPPELLVRLLAREGLADDAEASQRALTLVDGWLGSPLLAELAGAPVQPELPFFLGLGPTVIRGQIDLFAAGEVPTVVDYKTDALDGRSPQELAERYRAQREVYALAAGDRGARVAHVFLERPGQPVEVIVGPEELGAVRARLEAIVERMRAGQFAPTEDAYAALCHGCPAAARLCPNAKWKPSGLRQ